MRSTFNPITNLALGASVPASLALAWQADQWLVGAAGATAGLCLLALNQPGSRKQHLLERLRQLQSQTTAEDESAAAVRTAENSEPPDLIGQMLAQGRSALLLRPQIAGSLSAEERVRAQSAFDDALAMVPQGPVLMRSRACEEAGENHAAIGERLVQVDGFFLDRFPVTNAEYQHFVDAGGYEQMSLWDEAIWPAVLGFVDQAGQGGPKFWNAGKHPTEKAQHPVVGICWYEAAAYARWAGKRLATDPEWVKAGCWPVCEVGVSPQQRKFPWGDAMDRALVNIWGSGFDGTVPVDATPQSASVGGVQQLVGNVWEWTSGSFGAWEPAKTRIETPAPMRSIRGGAFDTYFDTQTHCQFQSGESPLARKHNIGFRCAVSFGDLAPADDVSPAVLSEVNA